MGSMALVSTTAVDGPQPAAGSVAVPDADGLPTGEAAGVVAGAVAGGLGAGLGAVPANVTGTNTSCDRSSVRVWSLRVTTAHATTRQSMVVVEGRLHLELDAERAARSVRCRQPGGIDGWVGRHPDGAAAGPGQVHAAAAGRRQLTRRRHDAERDVDALAGVVARSGDRHGDPGRVQVGRRRHGQRLAAGPGGRGLCADRVARR